MDTSPGRASVSRRAIPQVRVEGESTLALIHDAGAREIPRPAGKSAGLRDDSSIAPEEETLR
jgi:hypothetical protein